MKRRDLDAAPELEAFLEATPIERRVPADLRARVLARGRAIIAAGPAIPGAPIHELAIPPQVPVTRGRGRVWIAWAAALAVASGAVGAAAALRSHIAARAQNAAAVPASVAAVPAAHTRRPAEPSSEATPAAEERDANASRNRRARPTANADAVTAELDVLQRAHAAYTRRDFSTALALAAEHARRFPTGQLAEQREALRVRSLFGSGRSEEARRAATVFAARFPRSVLLPRIQDKQ
jgi:hypothetical protein